MQIRIQQCSGSIGTLKTRIRPLFALINLLKKYRHQQKIDTNLVKKFHNKSNNKIIKFVEKRLEKCEALKKITYAQLWWVGCEYVNPIS